MRRRADMTAMLARRPASAGGSRVGRSEPGKWAGISDAKAGGHIGNTVVAMAAGSKSGIRRCRDEPQGRQG